MILFAGWNWSLALKGQTVIEFWGQRLPNTEGKRYDFRRRDFVENLKVSFGEFRVLT
jgi:hypothetical protein